MLSLANVALHGGCVGHVGERERERKKEREMERKAQYDDGSECRRAAGLSWSICRVTTATVTASATACNCCKGDGQKSIRNQKSIRGQKSINVGNQSEGHKSNKR
jgi:hypothetical protein